MDSKYDAKAAHVEERTHRAASITIDDVNTTHVEGAKEATSKEQNLSIRDACKLYPKAIAFSLIFSTAIIMEGYDLSLIGSFMGFPVFQEHYGVAIGGGDYEIPAMWQTAISNGVQVGSIIGLLLNGIISERFGYKKTMIGSLLAMIAFIFIPFFATNIEMLLAGEILCGVPWGVFQTLSVAYASDVAPVALRPILTTYVNLCWVFGQFIAAGVLRGFLTKTDQWAYRIPFAIQWIWPPLILIGVILAPESPWWLVRHQRYEDARKSLLGLTRQNTGIPFDIDNQIALIKQTDDMEKKVSVGTSYFDCFKGVDRRRTEITCMVWLAQAWCGAALMGYSVQLYQRAGLSVENAFNFNLGQYAIGAVGTVGSWFIMPHFGRRALYVYGLGVLTCILIATGICGSLGDGKGPSLGAGTTLLIYTFVYDLTVGPVCYSLVAELPSTRLKIKTVVLSRAIYNIGGIINNVIVPRMLLKTEWNWGAKSGFFWAAACFLFVVYFYFRLPEPKGRTYAQLDALFEHNVSARKFASTHIDEFGSESDASSMEKY